MATILSKLVLSVAIILSFNVHAIETDKAAHFGVGYIISDVAFHGCSQLFHLTKEDNKFGCRLGAILLTSLVGVLKEAADTKADPKDFGYTVLGGAVAQVKIKVLEWE